MKQKPAKLTKEVLQDWINQRLPKGYTAKVTKLKKEKKQLRYKQMEIKF